MTKGQEWRLIDGLILNNQKNNYQKFLFEIFKNVNKLNFILTGSLNSYAICLFKSTMQMPGGT
jgi:hypothetical protein